MKADPPWSVEVGPGRQANESSYVLRVRSSVPVDLITIVGDAVHNMRSALDTIAYTLAQDYVRRPLTESEEQATQFPICKDGTIFDAFFQKKGRQQLYGAQELLALRCVQPFSFAEEAVALGVDPMTTPEDDRDSDAIYRLHQLSIIDKHRRLPLLSWFPGIVYWSTPAGQGQSYRWQPVATEFKDGTVLGYFSDPDGQAPPAATVFHDMQLALMDDLVRDWDVAKCLSAWHDGLARWSFPRIFIVASGNPVPMMISYRKST